MGTRPDHHGIDISYTLRGQDGSFKDASVRSVHVPRVGELVTFDHYDSYQVVDVLWTAHQGEHSVVVTACERDWHAHIEDVLQPWRGAALDPADARRLVDLMALIDWSDDESGGSAIPDVLHQTLDVERGTMLVNGLLDWDTIRKNGARAADDAVFRLGVVYVIPSFDGASPETDRALGSLLSRTSMSMCESPGAAEGFGRRWREDLCNTAWRLVFADNRGRKHDDT